MLRRYSVVASFYVAACVSPNVLLYVVIVYFGKVIVACYVPIGSLGVL